MSIEYTAKFYEYVDLFFLSHFPGSGQPLTAGYADAWVMTEERSISATVVYCRGVHYYASNKHIGVESVRAEHRELRAGAKHFWAAS